jgi:transcriptional regulator GlxA family with amidase domain
VKKGQVQEMRIAFVLFDGMTSMDFAGFYEVITWLAILKAKENVSWTFCADRDEVTDDRGLKLKADKVIRIWVNLIWYFSRAGIA